MTNQEVIETIKANYPPENYSMLREALDIAIALLKSQEPRVVTLEEVKTLNRDTVVWYEHKGVHPPRPRVVSYVNDDHITFTDGCTWNFEKDGYVSHWRLWTQRPTDEQREATKWID